MQGILLLDTKTAPHKESVYLFSGLLICADCGNRMTRKIIIYGKKVFIAIVFKKLLLNIIYNEYKSLISF